MKVVVKDDLSIEHIEGYDQLMTFKPHVFNISLDDVKIIKHKNNFYVYNKSDADNPLIQEWRNVENFQYVGGFDSVKKALDKEIFNLTTITFRVNEIPTSFNRRFVRFLKHKETLVTEEVIIAKRIIEKLEKKASVDLPHKDVHTLCALMNLTYEDFMEYVENYKS